MITKDIEEAIRLLESAAAQLISKRDELWKESDELKKEEGDWVPFNHAGNDCDRIEMVVSHCAEYVKSQTKNISAILKKHGISEGE